MTVVVLTDRYVTARKEHACGICRASIGTGERYRRIAEVVDGVFYSRKEHERHEIERLGRL